MTIPRKAIFAGVYIYTCISFYLKKLYQGVLLYLYSNNILIYTPTYNIITYCTDEDEFKISVNLNAYDIYNNDITDKVKYLLHYFGNHTNILKKYLPPSIKIMYLWNKKIYMHLVEFKENSISTSHMDIKCENSESYDIDFNRLNFEHTD